MIIVGDIGGTKTNLAVFGEIEGEPYSYFATYHSKNFPSLQTIVLKFIEEWDLSSHLKQIHAGCFAVAGPCRGGVCVATNLSWVVDANEMKKALAIPHVFLINDLEANAWALDILPQESLYTLYEGKGPRGGNRTVISPGTGLGEAGIYWDGSKSHPFACEGGHCEFGPRNEQQVELCRFIIQKYGHASYERVLSGPGLINIYQFFKERIQIKEENWLIEELKGGDPARAITRNALLNTSEICVKTLNLFASVLGSEAANCALKFLAEGGVYLGGGIPPKILPKLKEPVFFEAFVDKGRFREFLQEIPIYVILDDQASLKGAAHYCRVKCVS